VSRLRAELWVVAGPPGSGKSTFAQALARALSPAPAVLDKDTLFSGFVAEVLAAHGRDHGEREGDWYDVHVKVHEYAGMAAAAGQIRAAGCPVVLVAPYTGQIRDAGRWAELVASAGGEPGRLLWVASDAETLRRRLPARGRARDAGKLADFDAFVVRTAPDVPPPVPHLAIDGRDGARPFAEQLAALGIGR
jgi:predicted kinase